MRDILRCLRGGGWCQMVEIDFNAQSDNGSLTDGHALRQWSQAYLRAMEQHKNPRAPRRLAGWMRNAGFTEVNERMIPLPMCGWSDSQREYEIGVANQENVRLLLSSLALYPFTERLGMSITEFHVLVAQARLEASNPALKVGPPRLSCKLNICGQIWIALTCLVMVISHISHCTYVSVESRGAKNIRRRVRQG
ncbi:hypothetical protein F5B20DRAFT_397932 [Whalleya microplaca]|nr:hypothetical protein F5B20DRAFT_397932 [Whalleya microplaca]